MPQWLPCVSECERACGARSGEEETWRVIFINMASPAKIQGVLLHPAVTGCSEASSSWQHSPARLLKVVHPVLNRAARRTSDALGDSQRKTERDRRGKKKKKNDFKVTNREHFSDAALGLLTLCNYPPAPTTTSPTLS